jgi:mannose-6-phosphate isomerase-like protein (cupin superfamily)
MKADRYRDQGGVRRVVTSVGPDGKARVDIDELAPSIFAFESEPNFRQDDVWVTTWPVDPNGPDLVATTGPVPLDPPPGGTIFRLAILPPDERMVELTGDPSFMDEFATKYDGGDAHSDDDFQYHRSNTIDYVQVLSGEVVLELDSGDEIELRRGDCVVQRGTNHAWRNRSGRPVVVSSVLLSTVAPEEP